METFGVIVICTKRDYLFAKGCCASVRYFMGDVPLCLLVDGDFNYQDLLETYDARVINRDTIQNSELKKRSFGWGITRMIAFWESPFDRFLLIDSDTCVWGDMHYYLDRLDANDIVLDKPRYAYSEKDICDWFFKVPEIRQLFPDFHVLDHPYVCPGILMSRKNIFDLSGYFQILDLAEKRPGLFFPGDMGFINLMIYKAKEEGRLKVANEAIQYLVCDFKASEMKASFPIHETPAMTGSPTVLHFTGGIKPIRYADDNFYTEPAIYFRKKYLGDSRSISGWRTDAILRYEDMQWKYRTQLPYYRKRLKGLFGLSS